MPDATPFGDVSPETSALLGGVCVRRRFARGETLYDQGCPAHELMMIETGRVKVTRLTEAGDAHTLIVVGAGEVIGSIAVVQDKPHRISAVAATAVTALGWNARVVRQALVQDRAISAQFLQFVSRRSDELIELLDETVSLSVEERLARALLRLAGKFGRHTEELSIAVAVGQADLAEMVRTTVPTISRIITRWRHDQIVGGRRGEVVIRDIARLAERGRLVLD
ncbi:Crp/Fnr family transcriptional regulator [Sphingomonas sp. ID0503]|uniref:Crp/Fnr family transcriptional regulator n=1 Tax=Sphingomonas sp. ID0503 TaxID=3399691 RepID=UPI003AFA8CD1